MPRKLAKQTTKKLSEMAINESFESGRFGDNDGILKINIAGWDGFSVEAKFTEKKSFSINKDILLTCEQKAKRENKLPLWVIGMVGGNKNSTYVLLTQNDFNAILDVIRELGQ